MFKRTLQCLLAGSVLIFGVNQSAAWGINKGDVDVFGNRKLSISSDILAAPPDEGLMITCTSPDELHIAWLFPIQGWSTEDIEGLQDAEASLVVKSGISTATVSVTGQTWNKNYLAYATTNKDDINKIIDVLRTKNNTILVGLAMAGGGKSSGKIDSRNNAAATAAFDEICKVANGKGPEG